jgi:hypothetical protein
MPEDEKRDKSKQRAGRLDKFEPGGESGPIQDRNKREQRLNSLPPDQKEVAQESARLSDLSQYFSEQKIDVPSSLLERVGRLSKLAIAERIRAMKDINRALMEYLHDVGQDPGIRQ